MIKKCIYIAIVFSCITKLEAQVKDTISNLIILIDDKVPTTISNFRIEFSENNQKIEMPKINFEQGRLLLDKSLYNKILSNNISDLKFYFDYSEFKNNKNYNYFIEINKNILSQRVIIVYLYNLDDKEKRKKYKYTQLDKDRKYTFEIDGGSIFIGRPKRN